MHSEMHSRTRNDVRRIPSGLCTALDTVFVTNDDRTNSGRDEELVAGNLSARRFPFSCDGYASLSLIIPTSQLIRKKKKNGKESGKKKKEKEKAKTIIPCHASRLGRGNGGHSSKLSTFATR